VSSAVRAPDPETVSRHTSLFEEAWRVVADAAGIDAGTSVLDLGCGSGGFCRFAADRGAVVHGIDVEPEAIGEALERVPEADLRLGLMEQLPWGDGTFDVVTSFNAVQYALDPELALAEAGRVVRRSGRITICKWGSPAQNEFFSFLLSVGARGVQPEELPDTDPIEELVRRNGLDLLGEGDVPASIELSGDRALAAALVRAGVEADSSTTPGAVAAAAPYRRRDGGYRFDNRLRYWVVRPAERGSTPDGVTPRSSARR
jgi:SAM-dependent methyltransferase